MRLSEMYSEIEAGRGPEFSEDQAFATLVAIEHLAQIEGLPVLALDFAAPQFGAKYTFQFSDLRGAWGGSAQYLAWRRLILNAQMRFAPGDVDAAPWKSLDRADRLWKKHAKSDISRLCRFFPHDIHPREVSDEGVKKVYNEIPPEMVLQLRRGLNSFRELFQNDLALQTGLLPKECPSPLPGIRSHRHFASMSPEIKDWRNSLASGDIRLSLDYLNRLAVAGGHLNGETDTLDDLRFAICDLPSPLEVGIPAISPNTVRKYANQVRRALGGPDPRKTPAEQAWADLRTAARAVGCETSFLSAVAQRAAARSIFPTEISETTALEILRACNVGHERSVFRRGCEQFDALRERVRPDLLSPSPLGIKRSPPRPPKPVLLLDPVATAWANLYSRLREHGWSSRECDKLSYLRSRACAARIAPGDLRQEFIDTLERDITKVSDRTRLRTAARSILLLSNEPGFTDLPDLSIPNYQRHSHGGLCEQARAELEELMEFMNAAEPTRRIYRLAVGVLSDATGQPDISLGELLQADMSVYDLGAHEPRRKIHASNVRNLRDFVELPWTLAWRELQKVVTGTGMTLLNNPVHKILSWHPGTDPDGLTLEWARQLDRDLRSTVKNPPHGRADLAQTLARNLAAFDSLHEIPAVAESGLLPARIGPIR